MKNNNSSIYDDFQAHTILFPARFYSIYSAAAEEAESVGWGCYWAKNERKLFTLNDKKIHSFTHSQNGTRTTDTSSALNAVWGGTFSFHTKCWSSLTFVFPLVLFQNRNNISNNFLPSLFSQLLSNVKCVTHSEILGEDGMRKMWRFQIQQPCHSTHKPSLTPLALAPCFVFFLL